MVRAPSDRIHALVDGLGPRCGLVVTIDGVLATLASTADDDLLSLGRATDHADGGSPARRACSATPTTSPC